MPWRGHAPIAGLDRALAAPGVRLQAQPASVAGLVRAAQEERRRALQREQAAKWSPLLYPLIGLLPEERQLLACDRFGLDPFLSTIAGIALEVGGALGVALFVMSTDVDRVYLDYRRPNERPLGLVTVDELERYRREAHFPPGSMGPKVEAAIRFLRDRGREAIITAPGRIQHAVRGRGGTHIVSTNNLRVARRAAG